MKTVSEIKNMYMVNEFWKFLKYNEHQEINIVYLYMKMINLGLINENGKLTQKAKEL